MRTSLQCVAYATLISVPTVSGQVQTAGAGPTAISAYTFLSSLGVNTHIDQGFDANSYIGPLQYLGVRNIRDEIRNLNSTITVHQQTGVMVDIGAGCDVNDLLAAARTLASAGALLSVEGPNEPNNFPVSYNGTQGGGVCASCTWVPIAQCQQAIYSGVKGDPVLSSYPVFAVSEEGAETDNAGLQYLTIPSGASTLMPAGTQFADYANCHNYVDSNDSSLYENNQAWLAADYAPNNWPGDGLYGEFGLTWLKQFPGYSVSELQTLPKVTTETGWDSVANPGGEIVQGKVLTNTLLSQFKRGWRYTFIYDLVDNQGGNDYLGLFHSDYSPKLAATYIHNLTSILSDGQDLSNPGQLNYTIPNEPSTVHDLLLQKSSGAFELVIWDENVSGTDDVYVDLGGMFNSAAVYDIVNGTAAVQTFTDVNSLSLNLSDHAVIVELQ